MQKIIADKTYDADALSFTTQKAAVAGGFGAYTNATYLVIVDEGHPNHLKLMRAADAGIDAPEEKDKDGKALDQFVVIDAATGQPAVHSACGKGALEFEGEVNGVKVRTGFSLLRDSVNEYTMEEYSEITGVSVEDLERIAKEYTSHGTRAGICHKGGSAASVNGIDTVMGAAVLHAIIGANQMIGGNAPNSPAPTTAGNGARYKLGTIAGKPDVSTKNATYISRTVKAWETRRRSSPPSCATRCRPRRAPCATRSWSACAIPRCCRCTSCATSSWASMPSTPTTSCPT